MGEKNKNKPTNKNAALQPSLPVALIVQAHLLPPSVLPHARDGQLRLFTVADGHLDQHLAAAGAAGAGATALRIHVAVVLVVEVVGEEAGPRGARRRALHLASEVAARVARRALAERVGDLARVAALERDTAAPPRLPVRVLDQDELA